MGGPRHWILGPLLAALVACSGSDSDGDGDAATVTSATSAATTSTPAGPSTSQPTPSTTQPTGPPATRGPKAITFGPITFYAPANWGQAGGGATTSYIGVLAGGKGDVNLRVTTGYTGTIDELRPAKCLGAPSEAPARVELLESGFAPVGNLTAEYRRWRFDCPNADLKVEEHGVWLLPVSHIAIVEQRHAPEVADVVATAEVA
ncbi:MAG TPA: hypothetical protein VF244_08890 [Acidimicrobiales bacterium]